MIHEVDVAKGDAEALPRFQTGEERSYRYLADEILAGRLPGGTRRTPDEMAKRLDMSCMPMRQAVLPLQSEGLFFNCSNCGAEVPRLGRPRCFSFSRCAAYSKGSHSSVAIPNFDAEALQTTRAGCQCS
jgi:hypothetical protein